MLLLSDACGHSNDDRVLPQDNKETDVMYCFYNECLAKSDISILLTALYKFCQSLSENNLSKQCFSDNSVIALIEVN